MATIIDSLIVKLGLDSGDLDKKAGSAGKKLKDLEGASKSTESGVKKLGETSKSSASGVDTLAASFGKLLTVLGGAYAIKSFIQDTIQSSAALQRLSQNLNLSAGEITQWSNAAEQLGGSAKGLQDSLSLVSKAQTDIQLTGESSLIPYLNFMGVSLADVNGKALKSTDVLRQLAGAAEGKDRRTMANLFATMGFDSGTINLLLQGRKELDLTLAHQKDYAEQVNKFAPTAAKMQQGLVQIKQQFTLLGLTLLQQATPALEKILGVFSSFSGWIQNNMEFIKDLGKVLGAIGIGLGVIALATSPISLVVAGIGALSTAIALLWQDYSTWRRGGQSLIPWEKWQPGILAAETAIKNLAKIAKASFGAIYDSVDGVQKLLHGDVHGAKKSFDKSDDRVRETLKTGVAAAHQEVGVLYDPKSKLRTATAPSAVATPGSKPGKATQAELMAYYMAKGKSKDEAAALASNAWSESSGDPTSIGDNGAAFGLLQWHKDRQENFKKKYGFDIRKATWQQQADFQMFELSPEGNERRAGKHMAGASSAADMAAIESRESQRPGLTQADKDRAATSRASLAQHLAGMPGASSMVASVGRPGGSSTTNDNRVTNTVGNVTIQTQPGADAHGILTAFKNMNGLLVGNAVRGVS